MCVCSRTLSKAMPDMLAVVRRRTSKGKRSVQGECNVLEWTTEKAAVRGPGRGINMLSS